MEEEKEIEQNRIWYINKLKGIKWGICFLAIACTINTSIFIILQTQISRLNQMSISSSKLITLNSDQIEQLAQTYNSLIQTNSSLIQCVRTLKQQVVINAELILRYQIQQVQIRDLQNQINKLSQYKDLHQ